MPFITNYYHNSVVVYSYSKSLSVPGERIGYLVIPDELEDSKELIQAGDHRQPCFGMRERAVP